MQTAFTAEMLKALLIEHDDGVLKTGAHEPGRDFCAMEFIAKIAGEPWTDKPECVHPVLGAYCRRTNDATWPSDELRTETMLPLLAEVFGTKGLNIDVKRIAEQTIRLIVPIAMEAAAVKNPAHAEALRAAGGKCAAEGTRDAALGAKKAATYATAATAAYAYAAAAYAYAADAAAAAANAAAAAANAAAAAAAGSTAYADNTAAASAERVRIYKISIQIVLDEIKRAKSA